MNRICSEILVMDFVINICNTIHYFKESLVVLNASENTKPTVFVDNRLILYINFLLQWFDFYLILAYRMFFP